MSVWCDTAADVLASVTRDAAGASWPEALEAFARSHNSQWAQVHIDSGDYSDARLSITNRDADFSVQDRLIAGGYHLLDPRPAMLADLNGETRADWQMLDPAAFDGSPFVNEFLDRRENDLRWSLGFASRLTTGSRLVFGLSRARSHGAYGNADIATLQVLSPGLRAAIELHERLRMAERAADALSEVWGGGNALIAVDRRGRPVFTNSKGASLLQMRCFSHPPGGALTFTDPAAQAALESALVSTNDGAPVTSDAGGVAVTMYSVPTLTTALQGDLAPIRVLIELRQTATPHAEQLLSRREREVATMLVKGIGIADIAQKQGKSIETVRTQLKSAMRKLGVHTQAQLVSHLLTRR